MSILPNNSHVLAESHGGKSINSYGKSINRCERKRTRPLKGAPQLINLVSLHNSWHYPTL